jgi:signal peptidase II
MKLLLFLSLPLYVLDQVTKWLVLRFISTDEFVPVIPGFFYLVQVHNTGAAFGMLKDNNVFFMFLLCSISIVCIISMRVPFFCRRRPPCAHCM